MNIQLTTRIVTLTIEFKNAKIYLKNLKMNLKDIIYLKISK